MLKKKDEINIKKIFSDSELQEDLFIRKFRINAEDDEDHNKIIILSK